MSSSPIRTEVRFRPSTTLLCVQALAYAYGTPAAKVSTDSYDCGRVSRSSWPESIVMIHLISDLPLAGRWSASFSSSSRLGRRHRLRLRLRLVRLVSSFSRASRSPWGFVVSAGSATTVAWLLQSSSSSPSSASSASWSSSSSGSSTFHFIFVRGAAQVAQQSSPPDVRMACAFRHNRRVESQLLCWCALLELAWWPVYRPPGG